MSGVSSQITSGRRVGRTPRTRAALAVIATLLVATGCVSTQPPSTVDPGVTSELLPLTATAGPDAGIFDSAGRQVQLRGVNMNHLADYFRPIEALSPVSPTTEADYEALAALGYNVIRLVTTWSAWEPTRGTIDAGYLAQVRDAVETANRHGMYVVIDMHQDAWSKVVFTPADEVCPEGTTHQKGWDGAPAWATFTDGQPTCTPGGREDSPAVRRAWRNFYANRDGIRSALADLWGRLAEEFADDPGVAGYDLLNEPGLSDDVSQTIEGLTLFQQEALDAIRTGEARAGGPPHLVMFETTVLGPFTPDWTNEPNVVFAPHVYAEAIGPSFPGFLDLIFNAFDLLGSLYGTPVWVGEYNQYGSVENQTSWMSRFARLHDRLGFAGGTWYTWNYGCGDPHGLQWPATDEWIAAQLPTCPGQRSPVACPGRSYPRAAPGTVREITAEPCGGPLSVSGSTSVASTADLWVQPPPGASVDDGAPVVSGVGVGPVDVREVPGGWRVAAAVDGDYRVDVNFGA